LSCCCPDCGFDDDGALFPNKDSIDWDPDVDFPVGVPAEL
jgi:hypothetical protein